MSVAVDLPSLPVELQSKWRKLEARLRSLGKTLVAYSGGVDSAFLAWAAHAVSPGCVVALLADSPSLARTQMREALSFCEQNGIPLEIISTAEMERPDYVRNDSMRCFHCKDELFAVLEQYCEANGLSEIAYGVNADDQGDFRPGQKAARAHRVIAPLLDAALTKAEIRKLALQAGLRVWDKPASACLSSRIEYGREVTPEALNSVERGEDALRRLGFRQFRVRHHGEIVRIEIARDEMARALTEEMGREFTAIFKNLGFKFVTLDLEGFRSGSMNQLLPAEELMQGRSKS